MQSTLKLTIDHQRKELTAFSVPEMSLSSARATMVSHIFSLEVSKAEVIDALSSQYRSLVADLQKDDHAIGSPQDELAEAGYPKLSAVTCDRKLSLIVLGRYLRDELLGTILPRSQSPTYWLDTVTACDTDGDTIGLHGICYSKS